ncbi:MAG: cytochrome bc complex cytochrome b subunit [Campylobacterota bacterium]|nr:cytochrome bc complex cytochrome b subunit [Campylobacterota bacterium]
MAKINESLFSAEGMEKRLNIKKFNQVMMTEYWIPKDINFLWAMGVILATTFMILIVSGIFLMMYYKPDTALAFDSVNYTIMQEVGFGWLFRHMHGVAASVVFLVIYIHMFTGLYYGSYKKGREMIWISGMLLFVTFSAAGFSGYMLPWGQMSYWAAAVITNLFAGGSLDAQFLVEWIRGGYAVGDATLTRFFMLHVFLLPIVILGIIVLHFYTLRIPHVNNQESDDIDFDAEAEKYLAGNKKESKVIPFWPVFLSKDFAVLGAFLIFYFYLVFFHFNFAMDPVNFDPANPMVTPAHIYPEWYFLWSYEVLRGFFFDIAGMSAMDIGLIAFAFAQVIFVILPFLDRDPDILPAFKRPRFNIWFWILMLDLVVLSVYGKLPPTGLNAWIGFFSTIIFLVLFAVFPFITKADAKARGAL